MTVLDEANRVKCWATANRAGSLNIQGVLKTELRAAIDGLDAWVDSNATAINTAIPQPARTALTAKQKAALLMYVIDSRFQVLP